MRRSVDNGTSIKERTSVKLSEVPMMDGIDRNKGRSTTEMIDSMYQNCDSENTMYSQII